MIRVLVVDDHPIVRKGIKLVLSEAEDIQVAGEAASGHEALALLRKASFDVVTLDLSMDGKDGLETLKEIRYEDIPVAVLILSIHPEDQFAMRTLKAGANGYLSKTSVPDELVMAVRELAQGKQYITPVTAERLLREVRQARPARLPHEHLTDREFQVFMLIGTGKNNSAIAEQLNISKKTVSTHREHILQKMNLKNNAQIIHYVIHNRLDA